ncbi:MAG TPA: hypothetical protein VLB27_11360, partial [candidate division Zixibacteria bacterium]|nr:hypothetical protein [candidate division Zixibacteria bacterium]
MTPEFTPLPLPAPLWMITLLHVVTLTLHFAAMNFVVGGIVTILFGKFNDRWNNPTVKRVIKLLPAAMAFTITFGVAPLLFTQLIYHGPVYAASIVGAWFWIMIVAAAIIGYYLLYAASFRGLSSGRSGIFLSLALLALVYVSFVYSNVFSLSENPDLIKTVYLEDQSGMSLNPDVTSWIFRWFHMLLGAVTVGGFIVGYIGRNDDEGYQAGKMFFLYGMIAASLFGLLYLMTLADQMKAFMRSAAVWWLTASLVLSAGSLHFYFKKRFAAAGAMLLVSLLGMVVIRHEVRLLRLGESFNPARLPVEPQWGAIALFAISFVLAVALLWYMLSR